MNRDHEDPAAQIQRAADHESGEPSRFSGVLQWMRNLFRNDESDAPDLRESSDVMPKLTSSPPSSVGGPTTGRIEPVERENAVWVAPILTLFGSIRPVTPQEVCEWAQLDADTSSDDDPGEPGGLSYVDLETSNSLARIVVDSGSTTTVVGIIGQLEVVQKEPPLTNPQTL